LFVGQADMGSNPIAIDSIDLREKERIKLY